MKQDLKIAMFQLVELTAADVLPIRHQVLWPNKPMDFSKVEDDELGMHYGVIVADTLICVGSFYRNNETARLRKFGTLQEYQGQGAGRFLLESVIPRLKESGVTYFWCDARQSAISFYQKFGLEPEGSCFYKGDIPYYKMAVRL
ncbi:GNAT family N-acetyltransferase [Marinomonas sp. 2405UD68-3]|uniref:GNAT family N-acetyltransferase n=1 Tax=Marinomonas sp. 2405UD68-3 TaxID=3391835 RepID=UPI0039C8ECA2